MTASDRENSALEGLPLSEGTVSSLLNILNNAPAFQEEQSNRSSLPATSNWPGDYNFRVTFGTQETLSKKVYWTYSETLNKLYVQRGFPCPINFSTNTPMIEGYTFIRAMAIYSSPKHALEVVTRCPNCSLKELERGIPEAEHLIRSESSSRIYVVDDETGRHSVIVPYENPAAGMVYSTYLYRFACFGSCSGGPNRRPMKLVFNLERGNVVIGRCAFDLKICACPDRDREADEKPKTKIPKVPTVQVEAVEEPTASASKKMKISDEASTSSGLDIDVYNINVKPKKEHSKVFTITVSDERRYKFLKQMDKYYQYQQQMRRMPAQSISSLFCLFRTSSEED